MSTKLVLLLTIIFMAQVATSVPWGSNDMDDDDYDDDVETIDPSSFWDASNPDDDDDDDIEPTTRKPRGWWKTTPSTTTTEVITELPPVNVNVRKTPFELWKELFGKPHPSDTSIEPARTNITTIDDIIRSLHTPTTDQSSSCDEAQSKTGMLICKMEVKINEMSKIIADARVNETSMSEMEKELKSVNPEKCQKHGSVIICYVN